MSSSTSSSRISRVLARSLVVAAGLLLGYGLLVQAGAVPEGDGTSQAQSNQIKYEELVYEPVRADVVLLGSSLTQNLDPREAGWDAMNVGIGGGNSLTPLTALARSDAAPKVVFIEVGQPLLRGLDQEMLEKLFNPFTHFAVSNIAMLRQEYQPINVLATRARGRKRDRPIPDRVREAAIGRVIREDSAPLTSDELDKLHEAFDGLDRGMAALRSRGVEPVLYFVPGEPRVDALPRRQHIRDLALQRFPASGYRWVPSMPGMAWRTNDGIHIVQKDREAYTKFLKGFADGMLARVEAP